MPYILTAPCGDAIENLARDELLLNELVPGEIALYLFVNDRAVIIGRNQNPYIECDMNKLNADGVQLVRRITGGGAVYHDRGNLNYSFIASEGNYNEARQFSVILSALSHFGIQAELSGRNDITCSGLKFSGTAFSQRGHNRMQHGTLLVNTDLSALAGYLTPSRLKLEAKGVKSVRSRVGNLNKLNPALTVETMRSALICAFEAEYGKWTPYPQDSGFLERLDRMKALRSSCQWRIGESPRYDAELENRLSFGMLKLCLNISGGKIAGCKVYSDCLNEDLPERFANSLVGRSFNGESMAEALVNILPEGRETAEWLRKTDL